MYLLDPVFIAILIFGIYTSYTDMKYGKIKNISILLMVISGIFINVFLTTTLSTFDLDMKADFMQSITNIIIAFAFGFFIWLAGLWSQGDAKLFLGYSMILPVFAYKYGYVSFFPSIVILINTFIPIAIFYIINSLLHAKTKILKANVKQIFSRKRIVNLVLYIFGLSSILQLILEYFNISLNIIFQTIILFVLMEVLNKISSKATLIFSVLGSLVQIIFYFDSTFTLPFLSQFFSTFIMFLILKFLLSTTEFYSESMKIKDLKPGMILSEQLIRTKKGIEKREISLVTVFDVIRSMKEGFLQDVKTKLTTHDLKELQELKKKGKLGFDSIKVAKTVPFAPFMFFGVLLTYFLQGSLLYYMSLIPILNMINK